MSTLVKLARWYSCSTVWLLILVCYSMVAHADDQRPDALISRVTEEVLAQIKSDRRIQSGDQARVLALVERVIMPHVDFRKTTALAVGPGWRQATAAQRDALTREFRLLLVRTYAGALSEVRNERVQIKPMRAAPDASDVIVRTEIIGRGDPIELSYRLERTGDIWRIYDLNVLGVWLVQNYRGQFNTVVSKDGIDGLIEVLSRKNKR